MEKENNPRVLDVIHDYEKVERLLFSEIHNARSEVLITIGSDEHLERLSNIGLVDAIARATSMGVKVMILYPTKLSKKGAVLFSEIKKYAQVRNVAEINGTILIVDGSRLLTANKNAETDFAIYTTYEALVGNFVSFFDSLWSQQELLDSLVETQDTLLESNKQLKEHDKMQKEFINLAAHELRTPIQPLLGLIDTLDINRKKAEEEEEEEEEEVRGIKRKDVKMIARNVLRLERLSQAILDSARIESHSLKLNKESFDLNENIRNTIDDVKASVKKTHNLEILFEPTNKALIVEADKIRIFQVLSNILTNAVKFTNEGTIQVTLEKINDSAVIAVRDSGEGIDPELMPRLFTRFGIGRQIASGSGLGLYISKAIVEAHGGRIWAQNNRDGRGSMFTFTIPIVDQSKHVKSIENLRGEWASLFPELTKEVDMTWH